MPGIDSLPLFVLAGLLLNLTPGPDVLFIVSQALRRGVRAGLAGALGISAGCFVHIGAAALGISAVVAASTTAFTLLKWLGAAYLVWIGLRMLRSGPPAALAEDGPQVAPSLLAVFRQGFWTNVLNPKVALFFLAFLPQFLAADAQDQALSFLLLGLLFNFNALWVNFGWAVAAAWLARRVTLVQRSLHWIERGAGALFLVFGLRLALSDNSAH